MESFNLFLHALRDWVWGVPLLILLLGTGLYLTFLLKGFQFRYLGYAFTQILAEQKKSSKGDINPYEALMTTLAGAIGTGAVVGVSTGLVDGGLGSLFWMWLTALLGMATKYAESLLAIKYRVLDKRGEMVGGPMEYIEHGLKMKWLAIIFASFGILAAIGTGNLVQVNSIAESLGKVVELDPWSCGIGISLLTAFVVLGGIRSIGHVAGVLVPVMAALYIGSGLYLIVLNASHLPAIITDVFRKAFDFSSIAGGLAGSAFMIAMQLGVSRSVFSNEAGLGISSIAAAAAKTDIPGRQAIINMTGALISTVIVCTITAFVVASTGVLGMKGEDGTLLSGAKLAIAAFETGILGGGWVVTIGLTLFAFTTVLAWGYYGEKCCEYIFGERSVFVFRVLYCLIIIPGAALQLDMAWYIAEIANGLMAIPNLIALIFLSPVIVSETKAFIKVIRQEADARKI